MIFRHKGRDVLQQKEWEQNKVLLMEIFHNNPNERFAVRDLSERLALSQPAVRQHLWALVKAGVIEVNYGEKPLKFRLRAFYPLPTDYVSKMNEVLKHLPNALPPDAIKSQVKIGEKTEATVTWTGQSYHAQYRIIVSDGLGLADRPCQPKRS